MATYLSKTGTKYITDTPLWPGHLINNLGAYPVYEHLDLKDPDRHNTALNAEYRAVAGSLARGILINGSEGKTKIAMAVCAMSSGVDAAEALSAYKDRVLEHSKRMIYNNPNRPDVPHLTMRDPSTALPKEIKSADIFAPNTQRNIQLAALAEKLNPGLIVLAPGAAEHAARASTDVSSLTKGRAPSNLDWEQHYWGQWLTSAVDSILLHGDHGMSVNAALEKNMGHAAEFGVRTVLAIRNGRPIDFIDIEGKQISLTDQIWEDVKSLIHISHPDLYDMRNENQVAEVMAFLMYYRDFQRAQKGDQDALAYIDPERATPEVLAHFNDPDEVAKVEALQRIALPWIKKHCNWPTLHELLERDYGSQLATFWAEEVENTPYPEPSFEDEQTIMTYVPRGGYENTNKIEAKFGPVTERRDPPHIKYEHAINTGTPRSHGGFYNPFDKGFAPKIFNDNNFVRLGPVTDPSSSHWDPSHLTFEQAAVLMMLNEQAAIRPPEGTHRTLLYLDDPVNSPLAASFVEKHGFKEISELKTTIDPAQQGAATFSAVVAEDDQKFAENRIWDLATKEAYTDFWSQQNYGNILPLSTYGEMAGWLTGHREAMGTDARDAIAAKGPKQVSGAGIETAMLQAIYTGNVQGICLREGPVSSTVASAMTAGMLAKLGLTKPSYSGGKYEFDVFMDRDYLPQDTPQSAPEKMDFLDQYIHLGIQTKHLLEQKNPPQHKSLVLAMMRFNEVYEMIKDPDRLNKKDVMDPDTRDLKSEEIIDIPQAISHDPRYFEGIQYRHYSVSDVFEQGEHYNGENPLYDEYANDPDVQEFLKPEAEKDATYYHRFFADPQKKAKLAHMMWFAMSAQRTPLLDKNGQSFQPAESGLLWTRGIAQVDKFHYRDLRRAEKAGEAWDTMKERLKANTFDIGIITVEERGRFYEP
jgi:hypothetical protein